MKDIIIVIVIAVIILSALFYIIRARKRGEKCIGCPYAKTCGGKCDHDKTGLSQMQV